MACRVGITMNPDLRKREWQRLYPNLRNWAVLGTYDSKPEAQAREDAEANRLGCAAAPGGNGPKSAIWHVYRFEY